MMTDSEIRAKGIRVLLSSLGSVEAERFIALIIREPFDYTRWQQSLFENHSVESLSDAATEHRKKQSNQDGTGQPAT